MQDSPLEVDEVRNGARVVLAARGEVDVDSVDRLRAAIERAADSAAAEVWVDLSEVAFMDSTGLSALVSGHRAIDDGRRRLAIICPAGQVWRALEVSGLHDVLRVYSDGHAAGAP